MENRVGKCHRLAWLEGPAWIITAVSSLFPCPHPATQSEGAVGTWANHVPPCSETSRGSISLRVKDKVPTWLRELHAICPHYLSDVCIHTPPRLLCSSHSGLLLLLKHTRNISSLRPLHWLFSLPGTFFPQIPTWLPPSLLQVLAEMSPVHRGLC